MDIDLLLSRIDAYCDRYAISTATFGVRAVNDGNLISRLQSGGTITLKTLRKIDAFMSAPTPFGRQKPRLAEAGA